jgi:ABC-type nitrate/sulfonate/bicarbonate transport system ATPase subunit
LSGASCGIGGLGQKMITLSSLSFKYKNEKEYAIANVSCEIASEGISAIVGRSGVGKSTLLKLLAGIYVAGDPTVEDLQGGINIDGLIPRQLRGPGVASWVPQESALLDHLTVSGNIALAMMNVGDREELRRKCLDMVVRLGLDSVKHSRPRQLSGGMKTRVSLGRALISEPRYLFLDEPFSSLDLGNRWKLYTMVAEERRRPGLTTLITTHNIPEAMLLADRVVVMIDPGSGVRMHEIDNSRMAASEGKLDESLAEARRRALEIEREVYGAGQ